MAQRPPFPTPQEIVDFLKTCPEGMTKRELARVFHVRGEARRPFKELLRQMGDEGLLPKKQRHKKRPGEKHVHLPLIEVTVTGFDKGGDLEAQPLQPDLGPKALLDAPKNIRSQLARGSLVWARLLHKRDVGMVWVFSHVVEESTAALVGVLRKGPGGYSVIPTDRHVKTLFRVHGDLRGANVDDCVLVRPLEQTGRNKFLAEILEVLGPLSDPRLVPTIAAYMSHLPQRFGADVMEETEALHAAHIDGREDLRQLPFVTIDGADARDFDDAVWAARDPAVEGGFHVSVAIADVSFYVRPDSALDREAVKRGNSVYFPGRVIPMLPERLSNDLCSLVPHQDRAVMVAHMTIDAGGKITDARFTRAMIRSHGRLTYDEVQNRHDLKVQDDLTPVIQNLFAAYEVLSGARRQRGTLDLDMPERKIHLDPTHGQVTHVEPVQRLKSHQLIEDFMLLANQAVAIRIGKSKMPCLYRVHEGPDLNKLQEVYRLVGMKAPPGVPTPQQLTQLVHKVPEGLLRMTLSRSVLRAQSQAVYQFENHGHFGLNLQDYCHFTSPIRRYADLYIHRALAEVCGLGGDAESLLKTPKTLGSHLSDMERRAMHAERVSHDRYMTMHLQNAVGETFDSLVTGVISAGLFVEVAPTGASGFIPLSLLPSDFYTYDATKQTLSGRGGRRVFERLMQLRVTLKEVDLIQAGLIFEVGEGGENAGLRPKPLGRPGLPGKKSSKKKGPDKNKGKRKR